MAQDPTPKRGPGKSLFYVLIPAGFVLLIVIMMLSGWWQNESEEGVETVPGVNEQPIQD